MNHRDDSPVNPEHVHDWGLLIGPDWIRTPETLPVSNAFSGESVGRIARGTVHHVQKAVAAAAAALDSHFPSHARYKVLMETAGRVEERQEEYAQLIAREGSKTIREARREPPRAANILRLCAEEGRRMAGQTLPFDSRAGSENRIGYYFRFPVGVVAAITPFNDPLAMAAHKVGPALAAGNAVVLKPARLTPFTSLELAADLLRSGLPAGRLNVVTGSGQELGEALVDDPRVRLVSFTGGVKTGDWITRKAGIKKLSMELGSNSPVIVLPDADLGRAVPAIAEGAFAQAGQNCLGVQRVFVHQSVYADFRESFVSHVSGLRAGSPLDETTDVCSLISEKEADRVESWIAEAVEAGARVLVGNRREGSLLWPTVLEKVPSGVRLDCREVYGPVVSLYSVSSLEEAIARSNDVDYGLHSAIFTESLSSAFRAVRELHFGAVIVNDSTDYRLDVMPFGGTKLSGIGREGIQFAVNEMTETRVVCLNL